MRKLGEMLGPAVGRDAIARTICANRVLKDWPAIVGPILAERSFPEKFDHGTLWIAVEGSAWAQELRMQSETILRRLRARSDDDTLFLNLRFGVRPLPAAKVSTSPQLALVELIESEEMGSIREIAERRLREWPHADGA